MPAPSLSGGAATTHRSSQPKAAHQLESGCTSPPFTPNSLDRALLAAAESRSQATSRPQQRDERSARCSRVSSSSSQAPELSAWSTTMGKAHMAVPPVAVPPVGALGCSARASSSGGCSTPSSALSRSSSSVGSCASPVAPKSSLLSFRAEDQFPLARGRAQPDAKDAAHRIPHPTYSPTKSRPSPQSSPELAAGRSDPGFIFESLPFKQPEGEVARRLLVVRLRADAGRAARYPVSSPSCATPQCFTVDPFKCVVVLPQPPAWDAPPMSPGCGDVLVEVLQAQAAAACSGLVKKVKKVWHAIRAALHCAE